jgi:hypothetical protein
MLIGMTRSESLRPYKIVALISFVDRESDPDSGKLRVPAKPEARR